MSDFDLEQVADALERQGRHEKLSVAIRRGMTAASAQSELSRVVYSLELLEKLQTTGNMPDQLETREAAMVIDALFSSAVVQYARATEISAAQPNDATKPKRGSWFGLGPLSTSQRETHRDVIHLRQKEIAHFGKGYFVDGEPLLTEVLFLRELSKSPVNFHAQKWASRPGFTARFRALAVVVRKQAEARMGDEFTKIVDQAKSIAGFDHSFSGLLDQCEVTRELPYSSDLSDAQPGVAISRFDAKVISGVSGEDGSYSLVENPRSPR